MYSIQKDITRLISISRFYIGIALLTLILLFVSFQQIQNIFDDTNRLYQHPFKVSNASLKVQFHIQKIGQVMSNLRYVKSSEQKKIVFSEISHHESEILSQLSLISKRYLGDKEVVDNVYQLVTDWSEIRQDIFNIYYQNLDFTKLTYLEQLNEEHLNSLQREFFSIVEFANNKAKTFSESAKSNLNIVEKIGLFFIVSLLSIQLLLFVIYKKQSDKGKNKALVALNWSNELLDASPDAIIIAESSGEITQVNFSAQKLFGYTRHEFIGLNVSELMPKKYANHHEKVKKFFEHSSSRSMGEGRDLFAVSKSGDEFQVEISLNLAEVENKKVAITSIRDVSKQKKIESKVLYQANYDFLTNLPNRFFSQNRLLEAVQLAKRGNNKVAIMSIDLNDFKKVNDLYGHKTADCILVSSAARLKSVLENVGMVGRFGGDEFLIIIENYSAKESLISIVESILKTLCKPLSIGQQNILISGSIGISTYPEDGEKVEDLLVSVDLAMHHSKLLGKNSYAFFESSMRDTLNRQSALEDALIGALERNEFYIVYQPKYEISSNSIMGFEALLRWDNPNFKNIGPDEFIPILEQTGIINDVGLFVLENSLKVLKKWQGFSQRPLQMAVNMSPVQFNDPMLFELIQKKMAKYNLKGRSLEIEITEGVLLEGSKALENTLAELRNAGIGIALDDFGTGYSSLSYIKDYPITSIKIDRSFIEELNKNKVHAALVKAMISLAHSLEFHVTAEGIECKNQLEHLKALNCDIAQGYYLSRPLVEEEIQYLL
jgi:diguanylate cyclase (GGDEF)-like protein/PAS domain S-box-containing protein